MIIHRHSDGSEGFQFEIGDRVLVERTVGGGWFDYGPTKSENCYVEKIEKAASWRTAFIEVRYSPEWGTATCTPWHLKPHPETLLCATQQEVKP